VLGTRVEESWTLKIYEGIFNEGEEINGGRERI